MIEVNVIPYYMPERSIPEQDYYFYAYKVEIKNNTNNKVTLLRRIWKMRNGKQRQREVEGKGVVGKQPVIEPNNSFSYTSYYPLDTPTGNTRGQFLMEDELGKRFYVDIPVTFFRLDSEVKGKAG